MSDFFKVFLVASFLNACTPMIDVHGNALDVEKMSLLKIDETSYEDVQRLLGSPSSKTVFDSEYWIYMTSKQERIAFFEPKEIERHMTILKFDNSGILKNIEEKTLVDGIDITISETQTQIQGHSTSVLDELIKNIGRFQQKQAR